MSSARQRAGSRGPSAGRVARGTREGRPGSGRPCASMITHVASCTTDRARGGPRHTFGSLPRASPSGTMLHHAPRAVPRAGAAVQAAGRPQSARGRPSDENRRHNQAADDSSARRCGSARGSQRDDRVRSGTGGVEQLPFGRDAKGAVAYSVPKCQPCQPKPKAPPTAFTFVLCCGEPFDGFCCEYRHHHHTTQSPALNVERSPKPEHEPRRTRIQVSDTIPTMRSSAARGTTPRGTHASPSRRWEGASVPAVAPSGRCRSRRGKRRWAHEARSRSRRHHGNGSPLPRQSAGSRLCGLLGESIEDVIGLQTSRWRWT